LSRKAWKLMLLIRMLNLFLTFYVRFAIMWGRCPFGTVKIVS
jgi:hypothetical protein